MKSPSRGRHALWTAVSLLLATAVWLPAIHLFFAPGHTAPSSSGPLSPPAHALLETQLGLWEDPALRAQAQARMRATNAEWDFMGRTFLVLALANDALRAPAEQARYLAVMDRIIEDTLAVEKERSMFHFLMPYARARPFVRQPARSAFVDGEIALMLAARNLIELREDHEIELNQRLAELRAGMEAGPVLSAESYPDECWTFCNTLSLAAMKLADARSGRATHEALAARWVSRAKEKLVDAKTGLLVSSYTLAGETLDGPEGSSIWVSVHALQLVDPEFARDQYERAVKHLGASFLGFSWAREWPRSSPHRTDVDSGPIVPVVEASAGSSGLAFLGAAAFGDDKYLTGLLTTLDFAAFPLRDGGRLRYAASNQVGDAALIYALSFGPLWQRAGARGSK